MSRESIIINELERIWKETVMAYFKVGLLLMNLHGNHDKPVLKACLQAEIKTEKYLTLKKERTWLLKTSAVTIVAPGTNCEYII
jgi:hypothetical protein